MSKYEIIEVSDWLKKNEGTGFSETYWVTNPQNMKKALLKFPKQIWTGDHWVEKVVSEIGKKLNFLMPDIDLVSYNERLGCISHLFLQTGQELIEGKGILDFPITESENRDKYTIENIIRSLERYNLENHFIEMLLFDAFIGQQDRHESNWGIIKHPNNLVTFAPFYDNASALARLKDQDYVKQMLLDSNCFNSFIKKGWNTSEGNWK